MTQPLTDASTFVHSSSRDRISVFPPTAVINTDIEDIKTIVDGLAALWNHQQLLEKKLEDILTAHEEDMARKKLAALVSLRELEEQSERDLLEHLEFRHASGLVPQCMDDATIELNPLALEALRSPQINLPTLM
jgi:hypothetical protein